MDGKPALASTSLFDTLSCHTIPSILQKALEVEDLELLFLEGVCHPGFAAVEKGV
jgi:hypothetical protein